MKKIFIFISIINILFFCKTTVLAETPITTTEFYEAYLDVPVVQRAHLQNVMGLEIAKYLSSDDNPIDVKAAAINALSWKFEGNNNAEFYMYYLALLYHVPMIELDTDFLSADETFCLGYLMVMDNFYHPENALPILAEAQIKLKDSFTVSIITALAKAQIWLQHDWCEVWKTVERVLENKDLNQDLRPEAKRRIHDYMILYKEYCK